MTTKISTELRDAGCDAMVDVLDTGTGPATIAIRTGAQPTNITDASSGTLLATLTHSATAYGSSSSGVATAAAITSDTDADASGTAGHARVYKGAAGDTAASIQCDCSGTGGGGEIEFDNAVFVAGGTVAISSMTFTVPASDA